MLKSLLTTVIVASALMATSGTAALAADASGDWVRANGASKTRIAPCGSALRGKLVWLRDPREDTENPDAAKRGRPLLGVQIVQSMQPTGTDGKTYTGFIALTGADKLKLKDCVMAGLICKGETWTRAQ